MGIQLRFRFSPSAVVSPRGRRVSRCLSFASTARPPVGLAWLCLLPSIQAPSRPAAQRRGVYIEPDPRDPRQSAIAAPCLNLSSSPASLLGTALCLLLALAFFLYLAPLHHNHRQRRAVVSGESSHRPFPRVSFFWLVGYIWCHCHLHCLLDV